MPVARESVIRRVNEPLAIPDKNQFFEAMHNTCEEYKKAFLEKERMARAYGEQRIKSNPDLAQRYYEAWGRTTAYERVFHGLG